MSNEHSDPATEQWHLDKRIPLALIVTMMLQFGGGIWWLSQIQFRVEQQGSDIQRLETTLSSTQVDRNGLDNRITRIEEKLSGQTEILREIKTLLSVGAK
jgi:tRNA A-37 threonylcarbamoyl transferase component Bud32